MASIDETSTAPDRLRAVRLAMRLDPVESRLSCFPGFRVDD